MPESGEELGKAFGGEVVFEPDFGQYKNSTGGHRGSETGVSGERNRESKEQETESKGHVWGMVHGLQKVYRLNITLFIARILFCFANEVKNNNWKSN